jgi:hypothetical protein
MCVRRVWRATKKWRATDDGRLNACGRAAARIVSAQGQKPRTTLAKSLRGECWPLSSAVGIEAVLRLPRPSDKQLAGTLEPSPAEQVARPKAVGSPGRAVSQLPMANCANSATLRRNDPPGVAKARHGPDGGVLKGETMR